MWVRILKEKPVSRGIPSGQWWACDIAHVNLQFGVAVQHSHGIHVHSTYRRIHIQVVRPRWIKIWKGWYVVVGKGRVRLILAWYWLLKGRLTQALHDDIHTPFKEGTSSLSSIQGAKKGFQSRIVNAVAFLRIL